MHHLSKRRKEKAGFMSLKIEMSKTYNRVEWHFIETMMRLLGFEEVWIGKIMRCVILITFSILINVEPKGPLKPMRGIEQGDPLSPYLFMLCIEGLITLLGKAQVKRKIMGIKISRGAPLINNLMFIDDIILFCKVDIEENGTLLSLVKKYEKASS